MRKAAQKLLSLIAAGKEPVAEALLKLPALTLAQQKYLWQLLKRYELTLKLAGVSMPPEPAPPVVLPSEPHFVDFIQNKFILRLADRHAAKIHMVPKAKYDRKTGLYAVPYRLYPVLQLHKFVKETELYYTDQAKEAILRMYAEMRARHKLSGAHDAEIDMHGFGLALDPYQRAGVKGALGFKRGFIADAMGLGKTRQALGVLFLSRCYPALVLCPASVPINWEKEAIEGLCVPGVLLNGEVFRIWRCKSKKAPEHICEAAANQLTLFDAPRFNEHCPRCQFDNSHLIICNYDKIKDGWKCQYDEEGKKIKGRKREKGERAEVQLSALGAAIKLRGLRAVIIDESYYVKNEASQNTKATAELAQGCEYRLALSGTPIKSRTSELVPQLKIVDRLDDLGGEDVFYREYCEAAGGNTKGSSQETRLNKMLRAVGFIQRNKRDVRKELPPIRYARQYVDIDNREEYERVEEDVVNWCAEQAVLKEEFLKALARLPEGDQAAAIERKMIETRMRTMRAAALIKVGALKRVAAKGKLTAIKEWITDFIPSEKKLVAFCHQKNIYKEIQQTFNTLHICGADNIQNRQIHKEIFQGERGNFTGLNAQIMVCTGAAKEGVNLDAADDIIQFEQQWTPAEQDQINARVDRHRVHNITAWELIARDTIEEKIAVRLQEKRAIVEAVTQGKMPGDATKTANESIFDELFKDLAAMSTHQGSREDVIARASAQLDAIESSGEGGAGFGADTEGETAEDCELLEAAV